MGAILLSHPVDKIYDTDDVNKHKTGSFKKTTFSFFKRMNKKMEYFITKNDDGPSLKENLPLSK